MPTRFPRGLSSYGVPVMSGADTAPNANVFFVDSGGGSDNADGTDPSTPFATIDYAIGRCTANNGDTIHVLPGHSETVTTAITMDVAGVTIWGWGQGRSRPAVTTSGAIDGITVTAANCHIHNLRVIGAASATALLNLAAADFRCTRCVFEHGAAPTEAVTIASGANRFYFEDCLFLGTANGPDSAFFFEVGSSSISEWSVKRCEFNYLPNGLDRAVFVASTDAAPGGRIQDCLVLGLDLEALLVDFESSVSVGEGMIIDTIVQARVAASLADFADLGGYGTARIAWSDGANRAAILFPTTSAS